jgi:hypothetical protein
MMEYDVTERKAGSRQGHILSEAFTVEVYMYSNADTLIPYCMARRWYMAWCGMKNEHSMKEINVNISLPLVSHNEHLHGLF